MHCHSSKVKFWGYLTAFWKQKSAAVGTCRRRRRDCPLLKGNQAATPKIERPNGKNTKSIFFLNRPRTGADSSLESSMKQFFQRFELNQNKMKINDVFDRFTSKA